MKIALTGGGTGGHVYPAIQVLQALKDTSDDSIEALYLGDRRGPEKDIVSSHGIRFSHIPSGKLRRYHSLQNFTDLFRIIVGFVYSLVILRRFHPDILFSKGGFVSVPPVIAAKILRIPIVTHESDIDPGLANRINSRFVDAICIPYEQSRSHYASNLETFVTGNPVRTELLHGDARRARMRYGIPEDRMFILVLGGSQGALEINRIIWQWAEEGIEELFILHQSGQLTYKELRKENYVTVPHISEGLGDLFSAADMVISRAGAGAIHEFALNEIPMLLIPKGTDSSRGDQIRNAELFSTNEAAFVIKDEEVTLENVKSTVLLVKEHREIIKKMTDAAYQLVDPDAASKISTVIKKYINKREESV